MTASVPQNVTLRHRSARLPDGQARLSTVTLGFSLLILFSLGLLGFFYLQQVLETASQGSEISELENQLSNIKNEQRSLELESAELRSIQNIEGRLNTLNLVTTDRVTYLSLPEGQVAVAPR